MSSRFPWGNEEPESYYQRSRVSHSSSIFRSPRGNNLFIQSWKPSLVPPRALIFMVHGYGNDTSWTFQNTAIVFASRLQCSAFTMDLEGHGQSPGLRGFVPSVDNLAADCLAYFRNVKEEELQELQEQEIKDQELEKLPCFLYGESLGAAICLLIDRLDPSLVDGAILLAPMCKISDKMRPPWPLPGILMFLAYFFPTWAAVPMRDLVDKSVKDPAKRELARNNPLRYAGKPRLGTVVELLRFQEWLEQRLSEVKLPFLVIHGDSDVVTEPAASLHLYETAASSDKTLKIYPGMLHSLLQGEPDDNVELVWSDIIAWLEPRIGRSADQRLKQAKTKDETRQTDHKSL